LFEFRVLDANAEDDPSAPSDIKNEIIGVEGSGFVPKEFPSSVVAVDGFVATEGRSRANVGILGAGTDLFSVYFHDIDLDAPPDFQTAVPRQSAKESSYPGPLGVAQQGRREKKIQP
jgi:hypothetical protein